MSKEVKPKIYEMIDSIEDENILQMIMEDVAQNDLRKFPTLNFRSSFSLINLSKIIP